MYTATSVQMDRKKIFQVFYLSLYSPMEPSFQQKRERERERERVWGWLDHR